MVVEKNETVEFEKQQCCDEEEGDNDNFDQESPSGWHNIQSLSL